MDGKLLSVGLDVGTTSTQLVVSELEIENRASAFAVPEMVISRRQVLYESPVHFTPLTGETLVDGPGIRAIVEAEYKNAGITREQVDSGAVIITGETSRKENARAVVEALAEYAGDFVVATAGPALESVLAAKGAGADGWSERTGQRILHMDIGGGTANLALLEDGRTLRTGCLNVGGRLVKYDKKGEISYISPVLYGLWQAEKASPQVLTDLARLLVHALEMAAGLREPGSLLDRLWTREAGPVWEIPEGDVTLSFSGGVADCIEKELPWDAFGDLGPVLGRTIRNSRLCDGPYRLGSQTIRATVIGAGCHSAQLSGSTVFHRNVAFPLKNLPVATPETRKMQETACVLSLPGQPSPSYTQVAALADRIAGETEGPVYVCLEADMAKALGQALAARLPENTPILCLDRVKLPEGSFLDVAAPVGPALPVVVKTLVLQNGE